MLHLKLLPHLLLLWGELCWRCAALLVLFVWYCMRLLSLVSLIRQLIPVALLLLAPVRMLWRLAPILLAPMLLAPIVLRPAVFTALLLWLLLPASASTIVHIFQCVSCWLHNACVAQFNRALPCSYSVEMCLRL